MNAMLLPPFARDKRDNCYAEQKAREGDAQPRRNQSTHTQNLIFSLFLIVNAYAKTKPRKKQIFSPRRLSVFAYLAIVFGNKQKVRPKPD